MELGREMNTIVTSSTSDIGAEFSMNGRKLEAVTSLNYHGAILSKNGTCSAEIRCRIVSATAAVTGLIRIW